MNKLTRLLTTTALTLALASPAFAQSSNPSPQGSQQPPAAAADDSKADTGTTDAGKAGTSQTDTGTSATTAPKADAQTAPSTGATAMESKPAAEFPITEQSAEQAMASDLIGTPVMSGEGKELGEISDLILDEKQGLIGAVVSVGGFLGIGSKKVGVPWQSLQVQTQEGKTVATLDHTEQELADAAAFKTQEEAQEEAEASRMQSSSPSPAAPPTTTTR
jgi:sporulation protein YlmC with PRC-barrel domain